MSRSIVAVAIQCNGKVYALPRPNRHWNVITRIHEENPGIVIGKDWQGFLDNDGKFVGRREACRIAKAAGQLIRKTQPPNKLFSENLW